MRSILCFFIASLSLLSGPTITFAEPQAAQREGSSPMYRDVGEPGAKSPSSSTRRSSSRDEQYSAPRSRDAQTKVRVVGKPEGTFVKRDIYHRGLHLYLESVKLTAKNAGQVEAKGVTVYVKTPSGKKVALQGPSALEPNQSASYTAQMSEEVRSEREIDAEASCSNCYR